MIKVFAVQHHPLRVIERIIARHGSDLVFTYSRYEVAPPGLQGAARRSGVLRVTACDLTPDWLADELTKLGPTEEIAWHSWVEWKSAVFHIPMVDFVSQPCQAAVSDLNSTTPLAGQFALFETGRCFHAYCPDLIAQAAWPEYLGRLLLVNAADRLPVVDTRWVGHALVRGFTALRWSHNTNRYLAMPRLVMLGAHEANGQP